MNTRVALLATRATQTGFRFWPEDRPFIVANSFNFDLSTLQDIAYASISAMPRSGSLALEFYRANGTLVNSVPLKSAAIVECAGTKTVISYQTTFSGPSRVVDSMMVTLSPEGRATKIRSEIERTTYALFVIPIRKTALFEALYPLE